MLKQREDGLLQKAWEPFPERSIETARKSWSVKRRRILEVLLVEGPLTQAEIARRTGLPYNNVKWNVPRLVSEGLVLRKNDEFQISEHAVALLKARQKGSWLL